jgi:hypothetical protein
LALAVGYGWLGPDVDRGANFCETSDRLVRQPVNTLSNLGFVVAGLLIAWRAGRPGGLGTGTLTRHPGLATAYACMVVLLGPASMAMHATESELGGYLDLTSMYLIAAFTVSYAAMRRLRRGPGFLAVLFAGVLVACEAVGLFGGTVPVVTYAGNVAFAVFLLAALVLERQVARAGVLVLDTRWAWAAVATLGVAFAVWNTAKSDSPWCDPDGLYQGHAVWHLLGALSAWFLFRLYVSERDSSRPVTVHLAAVWAPGDRAAQRAAAEARLVEELGLSGVARLCPRCGSSAHGQPRALGASAPVHVSLAYTDGLALVAWSEAPVGVDVERDLPGRTAGDFGDLRAWTRAEALLKASGEGLARDPADPPDLWSAPLDLPTGWVGAVACAVEAEVSWRPEAPAGPPRPATPRTGR